MQQISQNNYTMTGSSSQIIHFVDQLKDSLFQLLKQSQQLIQKQSLEKVHQILSHFSNGESIVNGIQYFVNIKELKVVSLQPSSMQENDYQNLQSAVQKAQAQIRKHIRLQQQLKIYMDSLEERIQELEKQLEYENRKYFKLYESIKSVDQQKKQLQRKLKNFQIRELKNKSVQQKDSKSLSHKNSKVLTQQTVYESQISLAKIYTQKPKATKSKNFRQKTEQLSYHDQTRKKGLESQIHVGLAYLNKKAEERGIKADDKQMIRTVHMKQYYTRHPKNEAKHLTEHKHISRHQRDRQVRSNSVCN